MKKTLKRAIQRFFGKSKKKEKAIKYRFRAIKCSKKSYKKFVDSAELDYQIFKRKLINNIEHAQIDNKPNIKISDYKILGLWCDFLGSTVFYNGKYYKGILKEKQKEFERMWETGLLQSLSQSSFIPKIKISNYYSDDYVYFIESETINIVPFKIWNTNMIIDSCKFVLKINKYLAEKGYVLFDPHILNIAFTSKGFVYFDLGSFVIRTQQNNDYSIVFDAIVLLTAKESKTSIIAETGYTNEIFSKIGTDSFYFSPEVNFLLKKYKTFNKIHSSIVVNRAIRDIFTNYKVKEQYLDLLFKQTTTTIISSLRSDFDLNDLIKKFNANTIIGFGENNFHLLKSISSNSALRLINIESNDEESCKNYNYQINNDNLIETYCFDFKKQVLSQEIIDSIYSDLAFLTILKLGETVNMFTINKIKKYAKDVVLLMNKNNYEINESFIKNNKINYLIISK